MVTTTAKKTTARKTTVQAAAPRKSTAAKTAVAPVKKVAAQAAKTTAPAPAKKVVEKVAKPKKPKLVRDSFTIPKDEYAVIQQLKTRGQKLGRPVKKSELLRAGIKLLAAQADSAFKTALLAVPVIKTGRPKSPK